MNQKQNFGFYFMTTFLIGCSIIGVIFAQQDDYEWPTTTTIEQEINWTIVARETSSWTIRTWETKRIVLTTIEKREDKQITNTKEKPGVQTTKSEVWKLLSDAIKVQSKDCNAIVMNNDVATERARYACSLHQDAVMLASFTQESNWNIYALGWLGEKWVCQLLPNRTNNRWINDPRWTDWKWQIEKCVEKWKAVPWATKGNIRASYWSTAYKKYMWLFQ